MTWAFVIFLALCLGLAVLGVWQHQKAEENDYANLLRQLNEQETSVNTLRNTFASFNHLSTLKRLEDLEKQFESFKHDVKEANQLSLRAHNRVMSKPPTEVTFKTPVEVSIIEKLPRILPSKSNPKRKKARDL